MNKKTTTAFPFAIPGVVQPPASDSPDDTASTHRHRTVRDGYILVQLTITIKGKARYRSGARDDYSFVPGTEGDLSDYTHGTAKFLHDHRYPQERLLCILPEPGSHHRAETGMAHT